MPTHVCNGAVLQCSFGLASGHLLVPPVKRMLIDHQPAATIMDHLPMANITSFGLCNSLANPAVASATATAMGVLTPVPCLPATTMPWTPGAVTVLLCNEPTLDETSTLSCNFAGIISVLDSGQRSEIIP